MLLSSITGYLYLCSYTNWALMGFTVPHKRLVFLFVSLFSLCLVSSTDPFIIQLKRGISKKDIKVGTQMACCSLVSLIFHPRKCCYWTLCKNYPYPSPGISFFFLFNLFLASFMLVMDLCIPTFLTTTCTLQFFHGKVDFLYFIVACAGCQ